jgi:hypothetical protein
MSEINKQVTDQVADVINVTIPNDTLYAAQVRDSPKTVAALLVRGILSRMETIPLVKDGEQERLRQTHAKGFERWYCDKEKVNTIYSD